MIFFILELTDSVILVVFHYIAVYKQGQTFCLSLSGGHLNIALSPMAFCPYLKVSCHMQKYYPLRR